MRKIEAHPKSVRELLGAKYKLDYYQREYKWGTKQVSELLEDLESAFLSSYAEEHERTQVQSYPHYFLGSVILSQKDGEAYIIDGQQRLTSLTLLLIFLNNLQRSRDEQVDVNSLIFSERYGRKSFNIEVPERASCVNALYSGQRFDASTERQESVRNMAARYAELEDVFPETLRNHALLCFIDWLIDNVDLVEIVAYSDDDAYAIFETMNDRGLSLRPTDMLKGYLLANLANANEKQSANERFRGVIFDLSELGKDEDADFFKAWLRSKYADTIREREKNAQNRDFEQIAAGYHKWVRENKRRLGLNKSANFRGFVDTLLPRFAEHYTRLRKASLELTPGLEHVYYNAHNNFTLQYPLILAPIRDSDDRETADRKMRLVSRYLDIFIARRIVNFRTLGYSSIVYTMFNVMKDIRNLPLDFLLAVLKLKVLEMGEDFSGVDRFYLHQQNRHFVHYVLARMTQYVEAESGVESSFETYVSREIKKPFEIEHIWGDDYEQYADEFDSTEGFSHYRNRFGGLVLLPRGFNQSLGADSYANKYRAYFGQNLLAKSLNEQCYKNNPSFLAYRERSDIPFKPHPVFKKADLDERQKLYRRICEEIWNPESLDLELS